MSRSMERAARAARQRERLGPEPATAYERLVHTVTAFEDAPSDDFAILATSGVYGDGVKTGLTYGDLRALAEVLSGSSLNPKGTGR